MTIIHFIAYKLVREERMRKFVKMLVFFSKEGNQMPEKYLWSTRKVREREKCLELEYVKIIWIGIQVDVCVRSGNVLASPHRAV